MFRLVPVKTENPHPIRDWGFFVFAAFLFDAGTAVVSGGI
jgi:hypothetical protein